MSVPKTIDVPIETDMIKQYNKNWEAYIAGTMSESEWRGYCDLVLIKIMMDCREVFIRLSEVS